MIKRILFAVCITTAFIAAYTACAPQSEIHSRKLEILGTNAEVTISKVPKQKALDAITDAEADLQAFDNIGYTFEEECELNHLNEALANGDVFRASDELVELIRISQKLSNISEGLFNPAAGELTALWEYHCTSEPCPESPYPDEVMKLVEKKDMSVLKHNPRMSDININGNNISSSNRYVKLEFGDVIRGFAMDKVIEHLKELDIENAMIDIGPSVRVIGKKGKHPWWVGLYDASGKHIIGTIELSDDNAVVTASSLTKSASDKGTIYRHVVYPDTGLPVKDISSVTVVHESAAVANVAATALMIAGLDNWKSVASNMNVTAILLFTNDGTIYLSPAMSHMINWRTEISHKFLRP
ncbi:MAG: FAD:protein FMN transferase [Gammaproteobacteria bacterium]